RARSVTVVQTCALPILFIHQYRNQLTAMSFSLIVLAFIFGGNVKDVFLIMATVLASVPISIKAYQAVKMRVFSIELLVMLAVIRSEERRVGKECRSWW